MEVVDLPEVAWGALLGKAQVTEYIDGMNIVPITDVERLELSTLSFVVTDYWHQDQKTGWSLKDNVSKSFPKQVALQQNSFVEALRHPASNPRWYTKVVLQIYPVSGTDYTLEN